VGALTLTVMVGLTAAPGGAATGPFSNGTASATAQSIKVNPTAASLSVGVTFGISLAGYTNEVAKAESRGIDLGVIGTTLGSEGCDRSPASLPYDKQPQPLDADSRSTDATAGQSGGETFYGYPIPGFQKSVKATPKPFSEALTTVAPIGQSGLFEIGGARSDAITRVVDGTTREAIATSDIDAISILDGIVQLAGLHWEAVHRSGAKEATTGTFTVGRVVVNGTALPIPPSDPTAVFAAVNTALKPLGIELLPPRTRVDRGIVFVDALAVAVVPSPTRDQLYGTLLGAAQPVRQAITDRMLEQSCKNGTYITLADIAVGSITGAGSFSIELGGVNAKTGELRRSSFLGGIQPDFGAAPSADLPPFTDGGIGTSVLPFTTDRSVVPEVVNSTGTRAPAARATTAASIRPPKGSRGGRLAFLGAGVLLLLAAVAEGDRRKMRKAQRIMPPED
jgi:hypothetical protein